MNDDKLLIQTREELLKRYCDMEFHVLPVYGVDDENKCTCGKENCGGNTGKHPRVTNGFKSAISDFTKIQRLYKRWPDSNIAVATGKVSNIVVLDADVKNDKNGLEVLKSLEGKLGLLPKTLTQITGSGGKQFIFRRPNDENIEIRCRTNLEHGLDIRAEGGYIVVPPSKHLTGNYYEWEEGLGSNDIEPSELPLTWVDYLQTGKSILDFPNKTHSIVRTNNAPIMDDMDVIKEGGRNEALFRRACFLVHSGKTPDFIRSQLLSINAKQCTPPLDEKEVLTIAASAKRYRGTGALQGATSNDYKPPDLTDSGNSIIFSREYKDKLIFVQAIGWLYWTGKHWKHNDLMAIKYGKELSGKMLRQAKIQLKNARTKLTEAEATQNKAGKNSEKKRALSAKEFLKHALSSRQEPDIKHMLQLSKPELHVELDKLDADPFALNTPAGTIDLRSGGMKPHDPHDLCTCITMKSPNTKNMQMWLDFLKIVTCNDIDLEEFLQLFLGMASIGKVFKEILGIAYGDGRNGKSTLFNPVLTVLGKYGGTIAAEVLTTDRQNKGAKLAELKGKRLVIAAELEEGKRLSTSVLKQLAYTDKISAERKYKDPEDFTPSHNVVLYTNHKPKIGSNDTGTWRRIALMPFNARIAKKNEVMNYGDELVRKAGGAILTWIIDGAKKFHQDGYKLEFPTCVLNATNSYKDDNDWFGIFIDECCETGPKFKVKAGYFYEKYRAYADTIGEYARHKSDFVAELERRGFKRKKLSNGTYWKGISYKGHNQNPLTMLN